MDLSAVICDLGEADTASPRVKIVEQSGCIDLVISACHQEVFHRARQLTAPFFPSFASFRKIPRLPAGLR